MNRKMSRPWLAAGVLINVIVVLYLSLYFNPNVTETSLLWVSVLAPVFASLLTLGAVLYARRWSIPEEATVWRWLSFGFASWCIAEALSAYVSMREETAYLAASFIDVIWLAGYLLIGSAILRYLVHRRSHLNWIKISMAVLACGGLTSLVFLALLKPMTDNYAIGVGAERFFNTIYPLLDVVLATGGLLVLLTFERKNWWQPWLFLAGSMVVWAFADLWYAIFSMVSLPSPSLFSAITFDLPYLLAYLLAGAGCMLQPMSESVANRLQLVVAPEH